MTCSPGFRLGFLVNPCAGIGGPAGLKGSDDADIKAMTDSGEWQLTAPARAQTFVNSLLEKNLPLHWVTVAGAMGADCLPAAITDKTVLPLTLANPSTAQDSTRAASALAEAGVDLLVFAGGDGTARDVLNGLPESQPALGVPAGVKMHSGVYAITPQDAATVVAQMVQGELIRITEHEVRDIDEAAFRQGTVKSRYYGQMQTPEAPQFVQHVKQGGFEVEDLVLLDIADYLSQEFVDDTLCIIGPGSTTFHMLKNWGIDGTLLGVDLVQGGKLIARDADAHSLENAVNNHSGAVRVVVTAIGGQGHIIGRGNQQISPTLLKTLWQREGRNGLAVIATRTKLKSLEGRPLLMDSGDPGLDKQWQGFMPVITGFEDKVLYRLGADNE